MDLESFTYNPNLTPYHYPLEFEDLSLDRTLVPASIIGDEQEIMRSWANVTISLPRMDRYVFSGESWYLWHHPRRF